MRLTPDELKAFLTSKRQASPDDAPITAAIRGALIGHLDSVCGGKDNRHKFMRWIYGVESSADLWPAHFYQIRLWLDPKPQAAEGAGRDVWTVRAECFDDARDVVRLQAAIEYEAKIQAGQLPLLPGF